MWIAISTFCSVGALLFLLLLQLITLTFITGSKYHVIPGTGFFVDETSSNGDNFLFHGVNIVHKFHDIPQITTKEINFIRSMGFNVVRYGIFWPNIEPSQRGQYNYTYLLAVKNQVQYLYQNGLRVFLDLHQDCASSRFSCNAESDHVADGAPLWAMAPPNKPEFWANGSKAFPLPLQKPNFVQPGQNRYNPKYEPWGQPSSSEKGKGCSFPSWAMCYPTYALGAAVQQFYDNFNGTADAFAEMWSEVAKVFADVEGAIIGYELINEPWLGDLWGRPELLLSSIADDMNLAPLYNRVAAKIRAVDQDTPVFFEPATGGSFFEGEIGFKNGGPSGKSFDQRGKNVLSYHLYCPIIQADSGIHPNISDKIMNFIRKEVCDIFTDLSLKNRAAEVVARGFGGFLSEFGSIPYTPIAAEFMQSMIRELDKTRNSWSFWEINLLMNAPKFIQNSLMRSFPQRVPGRIVQFQTKNETENGIPNMTTFEVEYILSSQVSSTSQNVTADIFLAPTAFVSGSFSVEAFPPCCVHVSSPDPISNVVTVSHDMTKLNPQSSIALKFTSNKPRMK